MTALEKPTPPRDEECCESSCNPCVWDRYYEALREWRKAQAEINEQQSEKSDD